MVVGLKILGSHFTTALLFTSSIIITTLVDHSGYNLLYFHSPEIHLNHHTKWVKNFFCSIKLIIILDRFNVNYAGKLLDQLNGTYYEEAKIKEKVDS